jgi:hypothetical protein
LRMHHAQIAWCILNTMQADASRAGWERSQLWQTLVDQLCEQVELIPMKADIVQLQQESTVVGT